MCMCVYVFNEVSYLSLSIKVNFGLRTYEKSWTCMTHKHGGKFNNSDQGYKLW